MINASMAIEVETGLYHLWFEEMLQGDPTFNSEEV